MHTAGKSSSACLCRLSGADVPLSAVFLFWTCLCQSNCCCSHNQWAHHCHQDSSCSCPRNLFSATTRQELWLLNISKVLSGRVITLTSQSMVHRSYYLVVRRAICRRSPTCQRYVGMKLHLGCRGICWRKPPSVFQYPISARTGFRISANR